MREGDGEKQILTIAQDIIGKIQFIEGISSLS